MVNLESDQMMSKTQKKENMKRKKQKTPILTPR